MIALWMLSPVAWLFFAIREIADRMRDRREVAVMSRTLSGDESSRLAPGAGTSRVREAGQRG